MESAVSLPIGTSQAAFQLVAYGLAYVLPLWAFSDTRPSPSLTRDAPPVIQARIRVAVASTMLCSLCTLWMLLYMTDSSLPEALHALGYWPVGIPETGKALLLTAALFVGPLYEVLIVEGVWRDWIRLAPLSTLWYDWRHWRNIVAGPVTEEVMFRSATIPILLSAGTSLRSVVFLSPLVFGVAHVHHFFEIRILRPDVHVGLAVLSSLIQFLYTSLFGTYATFVYLRTGSLLAVTAVHAFCNSLGLPRFWGHVEPWWRQTGQRMSTSRWMWTVPYYALIALGTTLWWNYLYSLTESSHALAVQW